MKQDSSSQENLPPASVERLMITADPSHVAPSSSRKTQFNIPPILLEGDETASVPIEPPLEKFPPSPAKSVEFLESDDELPEAYGTQKLLLTPRDPRWLYAHWDLTREQQREYCARAADGHLILRVYHDDAEERPVAEIPLHPDSRYWFVRVEQAAATYVAKLGYIQRNGHWFTISISTEVFTPPDTASPEFEAEFATIAIEPPQGGDLVSQVETSPGPSVSMADTTRGESGAPEPMPPIPEWTAEQQHTLARVIGLSAKPEIAASSKEIPELIQRHQEAPSPSAGGKFPESFAPTSPGGISSPHGGAEARKGFWFNINAELIVYGATEANATVTIGGHKIKLRPDGSFSFRFSLPDGEYELPVAAVSADRTEARAAELKFSRATEFRGEIGEHPQDPTLKPPSVENL
jgi:uncharacterized protein